MAQSEHDDAKHPVGGPRYCAVRPTSPIALPAGLVADRVSAIVLMAHKWANGTLLNYYFFDDTQRDGETVTDENGAQTWVTWVGAKAQQDVVRAAFKAWKDVGIGLDFRETNNRQEAEVRIGFMRGDGAWSYIGTQILDIAANARTMNFGWDLRGADGADTALHEIGHTLGLPHEHQNPNAGIVWNEEAVYADLAEPPNKWKREKTFHNIIRKIDPDTVQGSSWDPDSIMHYPFKAGLIAEPAKYASGLTPAGGLSQRDLTWIRTFYPSIAPAGVRTLTPAVSAPLDVPVGQQADFVFAPVASRKYSIQTFGECDTQIVLFEEVDGVWRYLAADDDSGEERNALLVSRMRAGRRYAVRVRLKFDSGGTPPAVMLW